MSITIEEAVERLYCHECTPGEAIDWIKRNVFRETERVELRDQFAGLAMQSLVSANLTVAQRLDYADAATHAYRQADAMLAERGRV